MYCFFHVAHQDFAIPTADLLEIIPKSHLTPLPYHMPRLIGLHAHRGQIITLITLFPLSQQEIQACKYILVMTHETGSIGILCDTVYDIQNAKISLRPTPENPLCCGITQFEDRTMLVVDPKRALTLSPSSS